MAGIAKTHQSDWKLIPENKTKQKKTYSADEMIEAYYKGRKDQQGRETQILLEKLESNLILAKSLSETLFNIIKQAGFNCKSVKLKIKDISTFVALFIIDEDDFCKDEFLEMYKESIKLKKENNKSATFDFRTMFTPYTKNLSEDRLLMDGFYFTYGEV